jgi:alpha-D-ribose 1-methylphosphonate 5-phosphate C-P lyase
MPERPIEPPFISLMHGDGWQRCCICFEAHEAPFDGLAVDEDGERWDVCSGDCARKAGITEAVNGN